MYFCLEKLMAVIELLPLQILTNKKSFAEQATRSKKSHSYRIVCKIARNAVCFFQVREQQLKKYATHA